MASGLETLHKALSLRLGKSGFDLIHPFRVSWYNQAIAKEKLEVKPIPTFGRDDCPAFLIGHSKKFWQPFVSGLKRDPALLQETDPIDVYTKKTVSLEMQQQEKESGEDYDLFLSSEYGDRLISTQRVADIAGLAQLDYNTYLSIHPVYGPWIAFRGVLVVNEPVDAYLAAEPPSPVRGLLSKEEEEKAKDKLQMALNATNVKEMAKELQEEKKTETVATWRLWMAMREAMHIGTEHHYCEEQVGCKNKCNQPSLAEML